MRFPRNETLTVQRRFVRGDSFAPYIPSFPRRRESRLADLAISSLAVARLDSRLRGNDEVCLAEVAA